MRGTGWEQNYGTGPGSRLTPEEESATIEKLSELAGGAPATPPDPESPKALRRRRVRAYVTATGRVAAQAISSPRFAQIPEWLVLRIVHLIARGERSAACLLLVVALDWNWKRPKVLSYRSATRLAAILDTTPRTVHTLLSKVEEMGILRRASEGDVQTLSTRCRLPSRQSPVWILRDFDAWGPMEQADGYVERINASDPPRERCE